MIEHNTVVGTRPDLASGNPTERGFGVLASFQSEADLRGNQLSSNPVPMGAVIELADPRDALSTEGRSNMPHIDLPEGIPGIRSGFAFRPETAEAALRARRGPAPRREHAEPGRARADRGLRLEPERMRVLPGLAQRVRRGPARRRDGARRGGEARPGERADQRQAAGAARDRREGAGTTGAR